MTIGPLPYVPVEELHDRPHVLVDGATRPGSLLTLSHWPQSPTPAGFGPRSFGPDRLRLPSRLRGRRDAGAGRSSAGVRSALAAAGRAEAVTNDHFDEDGLVSVFAMTDPRLALSNEELLVEIASCGDFGVVGSRTAARIAFTIGPMGEQAAAEASRGGVAGRAGPTCVRGAVPGRPRADGRAARAPGALPALLGGGGCGARRFAGGPPGRLGSHRRGARGGPCRRHPDRT